MKDSSRILIALVLAIVVGTLIGATNSSGIAGAANAIAPIGTIWVNAIRMTVIPLVFSLLVTSIASTADLRAVGKLGGRSLFVFIALSTIVAAVMIPAIAVVFSRLPALATRPPMPSGAQDAVTQMATAQPQTVAAWLTSIVPSNPVAAAASGAMLPLIVFAIMFGVALATIDAASRESVLGFFRGVRDAMLTIVRWLIAVAPIGVFALALPLAMHLGASLAGAIGYYILIYSGGSIVAIVLLTFVTSIRTGVSVSTFVRAAAPPQLIALTSSSSLASLPALVRSADGVLALPERITSVALPLAVSMFKVATPVAWTTGVLFIAWFYGIPVHAAQLLTIGLATIVLQFGVPGIPRGAFVMVTPLVSALGLPVEGIGILIAVDVIPDAFATALNVTGDLVAATILSTD